VHTDAIRGVKVPAWSQHHPYDPDNDPLRQAGPEPQEPKAVYYYHTDHLGTPQALTDEQGRLALEMDYQAWGQAREVIADAASKAGIRNPFRFQGQYHDDESGLHYNRHRYYDPEIGRFISRDPIGLMGGINTHLYATNPAQWIDPLGLCPEWVNPNEINFSQRTVSANNYAELMKSGQWDWNKSPLNVMEVNGQLVTYDNRRLKAAQEAGIDRVPINRVDPNSPHPDSSTGKTWGDKFKQRFNDPRNVKAGGPVPPTGMKERPTACPLKRK
ncbi:RHS repeat-associated core domain-containing protein, partial [Chromobacterium violaceum]